ncbi:Fe-S cluster assembly ATPase SufC [Stetteria hydrogenophila]
MLNGVKPGAWCKVASLEVKDLAVRVEGKEILKGVSLKVSSGELHAIMGPNGSGKSTLAYTIAGKPGYEVVSGDILLNGESILDLDPDERALKGIFLGFQDPPPLPGVRLLSLVNAVYNKKKGLPVTGRGDPRLFKKVVQALELVSLSTEYANRELNVGFSGGEKKRMEVAQALIFEPEVIILDEPDSGLDAEGVRSIAKIIDGFRKEGRALLVITHYARLFSFVEPDVVTVLYKGRVAARGGAELARRIENEGFSFLRVN